MKRPQLYLWIYVIVIFSGILLAVFKDARAQTMCQNLGGGFTSCSNGTSSQRLGEFDFNSDGSWGMRLGGGMYLSNPPANPQPDAPQYPPNDAQRFETWRPGKVPDRR